MNSGPLTEVKRRLQKLVLATLVVFATIALFPSVVSAQGLEVSGGWEHISGNGGTDGFNVGGYWWFTDRITLGAQYDDTWDTSQLGTFALTSIGTIVVRNHLQNFLAGPRIFFPYKAMKKYKLDPFGEAQFGFSHLNSSIQQPPAPSVSASGTAFSWMLGGGVDYHFTDHWSARTNLDLLRTHLAASAQSHIRFGVLITYVFGGR